MSGTAASIEQAVIDCMLKVNPSLDRATLRADTSFRELGLTSLEIISIVFEVEERFGVTLVDAGLDRFQTVEEAVKVLGSLSGSRT